MDASLGESTPMQDVQCDGIFVIQKYIGDWTTLPPLQPPSSHATEMNKIMRDPSRTLWALDPSIMVETLSNLRLEINAAKTSNAKYAICVR